MWATWQLSVPAIGLTSFDHCRPGLKLVRPLAAAWSVENNLSLSNMDFFEFADAVDGHGVFNGF